MSRNSGNGAGLEYGEMGDRLREARVSRGLSLRSLAERLGVSPSLIDLRSDARWTGPAGIVEPLGSVAAAGSGAGEGRLASE